MTYISGSKEPNAKVDKMFLRLEQKGRDSHDPDIQELTFLLVTDIITSELENRPGRLLDDGDEDLPLSSKRAKVSHTLTDLNR